MKPVWKGFLDDLFFAPGDSAGPAESSIPFPLDEKPTFYDEEAEIMKLHRVGL
jgi:hypothetical protein